MIRALLIAALVAGTSLSLSCNVNDYCLNCNKLNGDGGPDGDANDGGDDAIDAPDASTCVPTGVEVCNKLDDDCDGLIDEGSLPAPVGLPCTDIGGVAGAAVGECAGGINVCTNGAVVCSKPPTPEQCDNKDNDCNGLTDEGDPGGGAKCGTDVGECVAGTFHCSLTTHLVECQGAIGTVGGQTEVCNNRDDDCDGLFDEALPRGHASRAWMVRARATPASATSGCGPASAARPCARAPCFPRSSSAMSPSSIRTAMACRTTGTTSRTAIRRTAVRAGRRATCRTRSRAARTVPAPWSPARSAITTTMATPRTAARPGSASSPATRSATGSTTIAAAWPTTTWARRRTSARAVASAARRRPRRCAWARWAGAAPIPARCRPIR
ncbi:MAG: hypothetical protein IPQ07_15270 [Myxococcales bacterium]|nr:hypothetical protein [Myxococcales bacterium]